MVTVIDIEAKQYATMENPGLFVMLDTGIGMAPALPEPGFDERNSDAGEERSLKFRISTSGILLEYSSFFLSSMIAGPMAFEMWMGGFESRDVCRVPKA